jgi:hypothetical protein
VVLHWLAAGMLVACARTWAPGAAAAGLCVMRIALHAQHQLRAWLHLQ